MPQAMSKRLLHQLVLGILFVQPRWVRIAEEALSISKGRKFRG